MPGGSGTRLALDPVLDRQPGLADLLDERARALPSSGCGRERAAARRRRREDAEQPAHLGERLAAGRLDRRAAPRARASWLGVEQAADACGLDGHDADAVGDDVVQLAGDRARSSATAAGARASRSRSARCARSVARAISRCWWPSARAREPDDGEEDRDRHEVLERALRLVSRSRPATRRIPMTEPGHRLAPVGEHAERGSSTVSTEMKHRRAVSVTGSPSTNEIARGEDERCRREEREPAGARAAAASARAGR